MRFIDEVCNLYDCEVIVDIEETLVFPPKGMPFNLPTADYLKMEPDTHVKPVVAIGSRSDYSAGLVSFVMTPFFSTLEELNAFCERHIERFRAIGEDPDAPAPDATEWDAAISH